MAKQQSKNSFPQGPPPASDGDNLAFASPVSPPHSFQMHLTSPSVFSAQLLEDDLCL